MNAYERHVIHTALQDVPGVTTYSTGTEPNLRSCFFGFSRRGCLGSCSGLGAGAGSSFGAGFVSALGAASSSGPW